MVRGDRWCPDGYGPSAEEPVGGGVPVLPGQVEAGRTVAPAPLLSRGGGGEDAPLVDGRQEGERLGAGTVVSVVWQAWGASRTRGADRARTAAVTHPSG